MDRKVFHNLKITTEVDSGVITHIEIDGEEIKGVSAATVYYGVNMLPQVLVTLNAYNVEINAEKAEVEFDGRTEYIHQD